LCLNAGGLDPADDEDEDDGETVIET
jgi:hypothetical protein